ncbi:hypothetical protein BD410DRAFT_833204 [Rickenella mellea]|uniref:PPPDE domain-containing protein n=1 Tax=Rickenella mellea TaxID=50990 RepID=A0A4Y7PF80_9AGAM|nr:hypothetical protein BD410DRAFT_833204 [Rickenella mellea]
MSLNGIYVVTYARTSTGGGLFHWGIVIKTADAVKGVLYHAMQFPAWHYEEREHDFEASQTGVLALKIGNIPARWGPQQFNYLFKQIPVGDTPDFTCRVWVLRAVQLLVANNEAEYVLVCKGIIQCPNVEALEAEVKHKAGPVRNRVMLGGSSSVQISETSS